MIDANLNTPITNIPKIGPAYAKRLSRLGIRRVADILFHFPHRYEDFSRITAIGEVGINETVTVMGRILDIQNTKTPRKRMNLTEAIIQDGSGAIKAVWFNQPFLTNTLRPKINVVLSGKTTLSNDSLFLSNPSYEIAPAQFTAEDDEEVVSYDLKHTGRVVPIYPETAGISSRWFRYVIKEILPLAKTIPDYLPDDLLKRHGLPTLPDALSSVHFPQNLSEAEAAKKRIAFGELFLIQLVALKEKLNIKKEKAPEKNKAPAKTNPFQKFDAVKTGAGAGVNARNMQPVGGPQQDAAHCD